jgi:multidrug efflux pump subunit AcrA (membrane-fusion protein)
MKMTKHLPARRTLIAGLVGLVVGLGIAGGAWWYLDHESTAQAATPTTISRTVAASVDTIKKTISTTGTLTPAVQQDVSFVASGNVTAVNVTAGQQVTAGQPLATVDTLTMQQTLASANLTLAKAQATLVNDQAALSTAQDAQTTAADAGVDTTAPDAKVATAQQEITVDQTSITTAQAAVDAAQTALNSPTLLAPIDGIVSTVNVTVGQKITGTAAAAGSSSTGSSGSTGSTAGTGKAGASSGSSGASGSASSTSTTADFVIVSTNSWKVDVTVDDAQIGLISVGDQAQLAVTSSTDPLFGTISSIGLISTASGDTASYPVEVTVTGTPTGLHDGTSATVTLIYAQFSNVLTVPSAAVHTVNGQSVVYTMSGDQQVSTPVVVGESDGTSTEITSGLNEGDEVVVTITVPGGGTGGTGRTGGGTGTGTGTGRGGFTGTGGGAGGFGGGTGGFGGRTGGFGGGAAPGGAVPGGAPGAAPVGG